MTEIEAELRIELMAAKAALTVANERIENYTAEKIRFIDIVERMNGDGENVKESLGKSIIEKEELITRIEEERKELLKNLSER